MRPVPYKLCLVLTTACDRKCPDCCIGIPYIKAEHTSIEELERIAPYFQDMEDLVVSGGEPTLHPKFDEISKMIRGLFNPKKLILATNAVPLILKKLDALAYYDDIMITPYGPESYEGSWSNADTIKELMVKAKELGLPIRSRNYDTRLAYGSSGETLHIDKIPDPPHYSCGRTVAATYRQGRIFTCPGSPGIPEAKSVLVSESWREEIIKITPPCSHCWFALSEPLEKVGHLSQVIPI